MLISSLRKIFDDLDYSSIEDSWIELPNIIRINLTTNGAMFREAEGTAKYHLDADNELLYKAQFTKDGTELGVCAIVPVTEIVGIETRNAYSISLFAGNNY